MTRRRGHLRRTSVHAGRSDHACWGYATDAERRSLATGWLADGLRLGQRALYVADGAAPALATELAALPDVDDALAHGALVVQPATAVYDIGQPIDADRQLALYDGAVRQAIDDGYRGLRVAADITPLIADRALRHAHLRWEQLADRYMTEHPLAPLCLYDTRRIDGIDAIAAIHPLQGPAEPMFALYGAGPDTAALAGQVDACVADVLAEALAGLPDDDTRLDLTELEFVDGHSAFVLHEELSRRASAGQRIAVEGASPAVRRVFDVCGFSSPTA
jgi:anti-anti-sigma factor